MSSLRTTDQGVVRLSRRLLRYAARRWPGLLVLLATMLFYTVLEALKPWPMKILVDNVLGDQPMPDLLAHVAEWLPGAGARDQLLAWSIGAMVLLFLLEWGLLTRESASASAWSTISPRTFSISSSDSLFGSTADGESATQFDA
jgi:hypothetical protein